MLKADIIGKTVQRVHTRLFSCPKVDDDGVEYRDYDIWLELDSGQILQLYFDTETPFEIVDDIPDGVVAIETSGDMLKAPIIDLLECCVWCTVGILLANGWILKAAPIGGPPLGRVSCEFSPTHISHVEPLDESGVFIWTDEGPNDGTHEISAERSYGRRHWPQFKQCNGDDARGAETGTDLVNRK